MTKKVSILIPAYNCEDTLPRSLDSVLSQTYRDYEVVLVDNNSSDSTRQIAEEYSNKMDLKIVDCEEQGIVPALNTGLRSCTGKWIARQDGDDYWYPEKLEKQMAFLEKNEDVHILGTQIRLLNEDGTVEKMGTFGKEVRYQLDSDNIKIGLLYGQNQICHPSVIFSRAVIDRLGGYEQLFPLAEDLHLWLRALPHFSFANLDEVLIDYTQKKSASYDARVPLIIADTYYNLYKTCGIVEGDREEMLWCWQDTPGGHKHNVD